MILQEKIEKVKGLAMQSPDWGKRINHWLHVNYKATNVVDFFHGETPDSEIVEAVDKFYELMTKVKNEGCSLEDLFPLPVGSIESGPTTTKKPEFPKPLASQSGLKPEPKPEPKPDSVFPKPESKSEVPVSGDQILRMLAQGLNGFIQAPSQAASVDLDTVRRVVQEELEAVKPVRVEIALPSGKAVEPGVVHPQAWEIHAWASLKIPVWVWGGAGNGKTSAIRAVAKMLDIPFYAKPCSASTSEASLVGYRNFATGEFVPGVAYEAFKSGGLLCLDEADNADPQLLACVNSLVGQGSYLFPNGEVVEEHPDFRVVATANTKGAGCEDGYIRSVMDYATLDRFAFVEFKHSKWFSRILCGLDPVSEFKPFDRAEYTDTTIQSVFNILETVVEKCEAGKTGYRRSHRMLESAVKAMRAGIPLGMISDALLVKGDSQVERVIP